MGMGGGGGQGMRGLGGRVQGQCRSRAASCVSWTTARLKHSSPITISDALLYDPTCDQGLVLLSLGDPNNHSTHDIRQKLFIPTGGALGLSPLDRGAAISWPGGTLCRCSE